jgi:hypothetical protein
MKNKVKEPVNKKFASIEAIAQANEASIQPSRLRKRRETVDPTSDLKERVEEVI